MYKSTRGLGRIALYSSVIGAMLVSTLTSAVGVNTASAQGSSRTINGHVVADRFLQVWSTQGNEQSNVYVNGLPITERRAEISLTDGKTYQTQWFERARFEAHPEKTAPYDVLLGLLGVTLTEGRGSVDATTGKVKNPADAPFAPIDKPSDADGSTKAWFQETKHSISGKIKEYWDKYGGLSQFGFPVSEQFQELSATDGKTYTVQYFERNRFELHPEKAAPYEVELGLLGVQQYKAQPVAAADLPIAPPKGVTSSKDTYTGATAQEPGSLFLLEEGTVTAVRHTYPITFNDNIVQQDNNEHYFPLLAWYVPTLENGGAYYVGTGDDRHLVVKYKLRRGIKWSDGVEVTAADLVFGYKFALDDPNNTNQLPYLKLANVDNPDKYTALFNYMSVNQAKAKYNDSKTDKNLYDFLRVNIDKGRPVVDPAYFTIGNVLLPQHILSKLDATKIQDSTFARAPIGYGPYVIDHWTSGVEMVLKKNPNYNLTDAPLLSNIVIKEGVALDSAYQQIAAGTIDNVTGESILVPPPNADDLQSKGVNIISIPAESWEHLDFYFEYGPFKDKAVRQAIAQAVDKDRVVSVVYKGKATKMNSNVPPLVRFSLDSPDYAKNYPDLAAKYKLPIYNFDRAAANKMLDDAGWVKGADGIRAKGADRLEFEYASTNNPTRIQIMTLIQDDLKQVGIQANLKNYTAGEYFDSQGPINRGVCKICQFAYDQTSLNDFTAWDWTQRVTPENPGLPNRQQYRNDDVTAANQDFNSTVADHDLADAAARAQMGIMTDIAVIPLITRLHIELIRNNFQNFQETINSAPQTWNVTQWYFK